MKRCVAALCGIVLSTGIVGTASAQGVGSGPWNGFYIGGHAGYGWGLPDTKITGTEAERVFPRAGAPLANGRDGTFDGNVNNDVDGFTGGMHAGYNFQLSNIVVGFEGDYDFGELDGGGKARLSSTRVDAVQNPPKYMKFDNQIEDLASFRGRLGYTTGSLLFYGTGGVAWANWTGSATSPPAIIGGVADENGTFNYGDDLLVGWVAGGGLEYKVSSILSLRAEVLHYDFGKEKIGHNEDLEDVGIDAGNIEAILGSQRVEVNQVRIGATFHTN